MIWYISLVGYAVYSTAGEQPLTQWFSRDCGGAENDGHAYDGPTDTTWNSTTKIYSSNRDAICSFLKNVTTQVRTASCILLRNIKKCLAVTEIHCLNAKSTQCIQPLQTFAASELVSCPAILTVRHFQSTRETERACTCIVLIRFSVFYFLTS